MKVKSTIFCIIILIAISLSLGVACAGENTSSTHPELLSVEESPIDVESEPVEIDDDVSTTEENEILNSANEDKLQANEMKDELSLKDEDALSGNVGTFSDLQNYIDNAVSGASIELNQDYKFDETKDTFRDPYTNDAGVNASQIISIDGKGHYIDGSGIAKAFARANLDSFTLKNIVFINCGNGIVDSNGGVAYTYQLTVENCTFINCAGRSGGAFYVGVNGIFSDCKFINCTADEGGAIYADGQVSIYNSKFYNNSAFYAGVLWLSGNKYHRGIGLVNNKHIIENCEFINNSAYYCGVLSAGSPVNSQIKPVDLKNNKFIGNNASGGSVIMSGNQINSVNNVYEDNLAIFSTIIAHNFNSTDDKFINNKAGSITIGTFYNGTFQNTEFENNLADDGVLMSITSNDSVPKGIYENSVINIIPSYYRLMESDFTYGYCIEKFASKPSMKGWLMAMPNVEYYLGDIPEGYDLSMYVRYIDYLYYQNDFYNMSIVKNHLDFSDVSDYLKLLIYNYYPLDGTKLELYDVVWTFTDEDYLNSDNVMVKDVLKRYENGERVSDYAIKELDDGSFVTYEFKAILSQTTYQNLFIFKLENSSIDVSKKALNDTVSIGDIASFNISITNNGLVNLTDVFVVENIPDGLEYISFIGENWTKTGNKFIYGGILKINETISFIINFNTTKTGSLLNTILVGSNQTGNKTSNDTIVVNETDIPENETETPENNTDVPEENQGNNTVVENDYPTGEDVDLRNDYAMGPVDNESAPESKGENKPESNDNSTVSETQPENVKVDKNATGNPILLAVLVLLTALTTLRRRD